MKQGLLLVALLVAALAPAAGAGGVNISWGDACWGDAHHSNSLTWACSSDTFTGVRMTCSFATSQSRSDFRALDLYLESTTLYGSTTIPDWWQFGAGECRASAMTMSIDASVLGGACEDPWQGLGGGGFTYTHEGSRGYIHASWAVPDPVPVEAEIEYFAVQFIIATGKTVGGECPGCTSPLTWMLEHAEVGYSGASPEILDFRLPSGNQCLSWQGGFAPCEPGDPVERKTWGQVKRLYR